MMMVSFSSYLSLPVFSCIWVFRWNNQDLEPAFNDSNIHNHDWVHPEPQTNSGFKPKGANASSFPESGSTPRKSPTGALNSSVYTPLSADIVKRKLEAFETPSEGIIGLWDCIQDVWNDTPAAECRKLIESMPRRMEAVIKAKGGYTKY